ncbi:AMP-binding protein [Microbacterium sp.]|uniref:AMP-binding protein n=1 Tax=Microbacterium sp. TaxID=51671 RepID=UPI00262BE868|nr:AMP-binding protein [Microbacterium sp.]
MTTDIAPTHEVRAEILDVEARRQAALIAVDLDALAELFDDSLVHIHAAGTTGFPKGATLSHYNILNNGYMVGESLGLTAADRLVIPVPLSGWVTQVLRRGTDGAWRFVSFQMTPISEGVWGKLPSEQAAETTKEEK